MPPLTQAYPKLRAAIAMDGLASQSALGTTLVNAGFEVKIITDNAEHQDVIFASAGRLKSLRFGAGTHPRVICLGWIGDAEGEQTIAAGAADDLMILPLRQQDISDIIARIHSGTLRGKSLLERHTHDRRPQASFQGRHVIVADDNAVNREVIIEVLRQLAISVDVAVNGRDAVEMWKARKPDLIFMDCSMPVMDGYTATREIRAHEAIAIAGGHTPVIALTAHVAGTSAEEWRHAGMDAYMTKPFTLSQIFTCLETQFASRPVAALDDPRPENDGAILDEAVLGDLRKIGGSTALFHRVLDLFAGRVPQAVEHVTALSAGDDLKALADAAHALKSMCSNIGAYRAVSACNELERAARNGGNFDAGELTSAIISELRLVISIVDRLRVA